MDEDEEVVLKHSGLYDYLVEAGFHDFESVEKPNPQFCCTIIENPVPSSSMEDDDSNWYEYENFIRLCLQSKLVFADDASLVENYMTSLRTPTGPSLILNTVKFVSYCTVIGTAYFTYRYFRSNSYSSLLASLATAPVTIYSSCLSLFYYRKYRRKKIVTGLLSCLKELSLFVQKSVQFILNSSVVAFSSNKPLVDQENAYFVEVVFSTLRSIILELKNVVVFLVRDYPLKEPAESHQYYLAFLSEEDLHCCRADGPISAECLQKMKYAYFLMQSELLRRICLCFIPNLLSKRSPESFSALFHRLSVTIMVCRTLCHRLKTTFELYYLLERPTAETNAAARRTKDANWTHREAYVKLCSVSFNLQSVLRESRRLERALEDAGASTAAANQSHHDKIVASLDDGARRIDLEFAKCSSVLDDFRRYVATLRPPMSKSPVEVNLRATGESRTPNKTSILVGATDFRPQWPDEVFVGVSDVEGGWVSQPQTKETSDVRLEPSAAKLLVSELKMALRDKAEEWKRREREALLAKNGQETSDDDDDVEKEEESPSVQLPTVELRFPKQPPQPPPSPQFTEVAPINEPADYLLEFSFARQIAAASVSWRMREEHFSLESDNEDIQADVCDF